MNPTGGTPPAPTRNGAGDFNPPITRELLYDLAELASWGVGYTEAATRVGYSSRKALDKALRRNYEPGRHPRRRHRICALISRLSAQDYAALTPSRKAS